MAKFKTAPTPPPEEEPEQSGFEMPDLSFEFDPEAFAWVTDNAIVNSPILLTLVIVVLAGSFAAFWWQFRQARNVTPSSARYRRRKGDEFTLNCQWVVDDELSAALPTTAWVCRHCFAEVYLPDGERPTRCQQVDEPEPEAAEA